MKYNLNNFFYRKQIFSSKYLKEMKKLSLENIINHSKRHQILNRINELKKSKYFGKNGLKGLLRHFKKVGVLEKESFFSKEHTLNFYELENYFEGSECALNALVHLRDYPQYHEEFFKRFITYSRIETRTEEMSKQIANLYSSPNIIPDLLVYSDFCPIRFVMNLNDELSNYTEKEISSLRLVGDEHHNYDVGKLKEVNDKNVLFVQGFLLPYQLLSMKKALQEKSARIVGCVSILSVPEYDPESAISLARTNISECVF